MKLVTRWICACLLTLSAITSAQGAGLLPLSNLQSGTLLVAKPHLGDPRFARTVILLVDYAAGGAWGVVVNKPSHFLLGQLYPSLEALRDRDDRLFWGGPVAPRQRLLLVRAQQPPSPNARALGDGLYLSGSRGLLAELVAETVNPRPFRVIGGYAGWGAGQLDHEFARGDWFSLPASAALVFDVEPQQLWHDLMPERQLKMASVNIGAFSPTRRFD